jgi:type IV pilus assembly protein PilQ
MLKNAAFQPAPDHGAVLHLAIPGYQGVPRLQVLSGPNRVVVDLPGVDRGPGLARKEIARISNPQVIRWRAAQFSFNPDVTRVVLEVLPGTRAEVGVAIDGVDILLRPGQGPVQAQLAPSAGPAALPAIPTVSVPDPAPAPLAAAVPVALPAAAPEAVPVPEPLPMPGPAQATPVQPAAAPAPVPVQPSAASAAAPVPVPEPSTLPGPVASATAQPSVAPAPVQPSVAPAPVQPSVAPAPAQPSAAPATAPVPVPEPLPLPGPVAAAVQPVPAAAPVPAQPAAAPVAPAPAQPVAAPAVSAAAPAPVQPTAAPASLAPLPSLNKSFQTLPSLAVSTLLPAVPGALQEPPPLGHKDQRGGRTLGDVGNRYTGTKMTIDVVGTDITSFLRIIADTAHLNLIVDQDVQGIYSFKFTDAPWDQVLDVILKHAGLGKEISNGIIRVAKVEKLQKEEEDRKRLDDAKALAGDTVSVTRPLSFAKAAEAKNILDKMLTKRGSIIVDERTNTLIITDLPRNLPVLDDLIAQLDVQIQQVQIEARVVEATKNWQQAFGVQWPTQNSGSTALTVNGANATWGSANGASWNSINNLYSGSGTATTFAYSPGQAGVTDLSNPAGQFWLSFLSNRMSVNVILQALESEGVVKVISSPKVVTQNNKKAKVLSGQRIPYPSLQSGSTSGAITVAFADADLSLEVTPQITNDGTIIMDIHVQKDDADFSQQVQGTPTITQKLVETQVLVKDGGTAIMGGVYKNTNSNTTTGVPFLSKLPLIGFLFRSKNNQDQNDELLVFITPRILKN